jgi:hypothetical protein
LREKYYSQRKTGDNSKKLTLKELKDLFYTIYNMYEEKSYFAEMIGYSEWDGYNTEFFPGKLGDHNNINRMLYLKLRKKDLWPIWGSIDKYTEEDLFDIIEFCFDNISIGIFSDERPDRVEKYDRAAGVEIYRKDINEILKDYNEGFEIDKKGNIVRIVENGLDKIFEAEIPTEDERIKKDIEVAVNQFRNRNSTLIDRKESIRKLVDILEYLKPQIDKTLTKSDERDLFNIANNFGIRHKNDKQKTNYEQAVWLSWMFYYYLSTIYTVLILLKKISKDNFA